MTTKTEEPKIEVPIETIDQTLPEAGGIAWTELYGTKKDEDGVRHTVKINLTSRAHTPLKALTELLEVMHTADEQYKLRPYQTLQKAPEASNMPKGNVPPTTSAAPVLGVPGAIPTGANPVEPVYEDIQPTGGGIVNAVKMGVTLRQDGKVKLDFYEVGHKYPDISCVMTPPQLVALLAPTGAWTEDHFKAAGSYEFICKITWVNSTKLNDHGKPYHNITGIAK
ncbi:MAG: hypothetical protein A2Y53_00120 [Chloroflexi bacterium RBG_16_47_49]|nr:MAG: hypothetical protein A2Y53_00120 [Chloroflexi bacterium RBG_16_47_49]